jgi:hypothetical protein
MPNVWVWDTDYRNVSEHSFVQDIKYAEVPECCNVHLRYE